MGNACATAMESRQFHKVSKSQREILSESLMKATVGTSEKSVQDGRDFYKFLFKMHPQLRRHFVGAHEITSDEIQTCMRFAKQGQRFLLAIHVLASSIDNDAAFSAYTREMINKHRTYEVEPSLWKAVFDVFVEFLQTKGTVSIEEKEAWAAVRDKFYNLAQHHLREEGLPTDPEWSTFKKV